MQSMQNLQTKPTKLNIPNQIYQTKPTKPNLPNQTCQTKPTKPNLPNQTYQTKPTKPNLQNQTDWSKQSTPGSVVPLAMFIPYFISEIPSWSGDQEDWARVASLARDKGLATGWAEKTRKVSLNKDCLCLPS